MSDINSLIHHVVVSVLSLFFVSALFLLSSAAFATDFVRPRPLMEYEDIMLAQELDSTLSALNDGLVRCVDAGTASPEECHCRFPKEVQAAKLSYERVLTARPKWKGKILYWKNTANLQSRNLVMPAVETQLQSTTAACGLSQSSK